jgi:hypothetical protein
MPLQRTTGLAAAILLTACATPPDCSPISGFELGRSGSEPAMSCDGERYAEGWRLGQTLGTLETEFRSLQALAAPDPAQRQRLRVLQREIPELETLARLEGWLPTEIIGEPVD